MNKQNPIKEVNELKKKIEINKRDLFLTQDNTEGRIENIIDFLYGEMGEENIALLKLENSKTKLQTLQKANKQFAEVLGEEIENLEGLVFICENCGSDEDYIGYDEFNKLILDFKQLKKEYDLAGEEKGGKR